MIDVAVVGLNFGREFVPLYQAHPDVGRIAITDHDAALVAAVGDRLGIADQFAGLDDLLATREWDAVHIATPVALHATQAIAVLESGRHCACAVPMATTLDDLRRIVDAQRASQKAYMMMETAVFHRAYLYARDLHARGELGELTFFRGAHIQNLDGFPRYWMGYPPMTYATHALSPILALAEAHATRVHCLGSGRLRSDQIGDFDNPHPVETALFRLDRDGLAAEVTMSFFQTARSYQEGFSVYGTAASVEWPQLEDEEPLMFRLLPGQPARRGRPVEARRIAPPDRADLLPPELRPFTARGGHGGSHPHLVHEFVRSVVEARAPRVDALTAAAWTAPGICAHESAMRGGEGVDVPRFEPKAPGGTR